MHTPIIALLTDFGLVDPYVSQLHGTLAKLAPSAKVIDISHSIHTHAISQGAFFLQTSLPYFPAGTIFICVVDPGVGSSRHILCTKTDGKYILAPDNGLLTPVLQQSPTVHCWKMHTDRFSTASSTFHGRDIFCHLASDIFAGTPLDTLGEKIPPTIPQQDQWTPPCLQKGILTTQVLHVDTFGNIILNLPKVPWGPFASNHTMHLYPDNHPVHYVHNYAEIPDRSPRSLSIGILAGSQGYLELACNQHSAGALLHVAIGDTIRFYIKEPHAYPSIHQPD